MVGAMSAYVTMLSMPLVGMTAEDVLIEVRKALAGDGRVERVDRVDTVHVGSRPDEHVSVAVRFDAAPQGAAHQLAGELHGRARCAGRRSSRARVDKRLRAARARPGLSEGSGGAQPAASPCR
jgi:hypothetical protein